MCDVLQCPSWVWQNGSSLKSHRAARLALIPFSSPSVSLSSLSLLSIHVNINKVVDHVDGKLLMEPPDAMQTVYLWLIRFRVCNHLQFPPLETQEDYSVNLMSSNRSLKSMPANLVDQVWKERPSIPPGGLIRLPDRVIRGFLYVCMCLYCKHTNCSLSVCLCGAFYLCADKYLQTGQRTVRSSANTAINSLFIFYGSMTDQILSHNGKVSR